MPGKHAEGGCTLGCTKPHYCGDGIVDTDRSEECDLGARNGVRLDADRKSTETDGQVYCNPDRTIPPTIVG